MKKLLIAIMLLFGIVACSSENTTEQMGMGSIYGIVTLKSTAEPMRATGVELYTCNGNNINLENNIGALLAKTVTYDDGHYEFDNLIQGEYILGVDALGYNRALFLVQVQSGKTVHADMQLVETNTYMTVRTIKPEPLSSAMFLLSGECVYTNSSKNKPDKVWFYYSQSSNNMVSGHKITASIPQNVINGTPFSFNVENVFSPGTWYIQAYAENSKGVTFGEIHEIRVSEEPSVRTLEVTNITSSSAVLNAYIDYEGNPAYEKRGFVYSSVNSSPSIDDSSSTTTNIVVSGRSKEFSAAVTNMKTRVTYYARPYLTNSEGTYYGRAVSFMYDTVFTLEEDRLMVQKYDIAGSATWDEATRLCDASTDSSFSDWRLPTCGECDVLDEYQEMLGLKNAGYWTCDIYSSKSSYCYYYDDHYGGSYSRIDKTYYHAVRCVRVMK